jgi:hypothetical protein
MSEWRPIETAPRDGSWFVIRCIDDTYEAGRYDPSMWPCFEEVEGGLFKKVEKQIYDWAGFNNFHRATHWLQLPPIPK